MIPNDPIMLLSYVNLKLRDFYPSLDDLCEAEDIDKQSVLDKLSAVGYDYNKDKNRFV